MSLEVKLTPSLTYKLRLSPQMKLSLNLLQMPLIKLKEYIMEQIERNPLLEPIADEPMPGDKQIGESVSNIEEEKIGSEISWTQEGEEKRRYRESLITAPVTLQEHLLRQLHIIAGSDEEHKIGELIIGNINDNGYLTSSIEDIAEASKSTKTQAEKVLSLIQTFEPIGVGARDLRECLLLQLKAKGEENSLAGKIVDRYLSYLEKKRFEFIAKKLSRHNGILLKAGKVPVEEIKEAMEEIASLEPKPGRALSTERAVRLIPDAILRKNKDGYEVIPNDWELPRISLNAKYKDMLKNKDTPKEVKEYLEERLKAGRSLIDAVNKRKETIQKIIEEIVYVQKDFLDNGATHFKPLTLSQIAKEIGKHKSTVSRAISNKYIHTPYGILELRDFINSRVKQGNGEFLSSKTIKAKIKNFIENENKGGPLTDQEIANHLKQEGISIARRTITKYRKQLKILPSMSRRFMESKGRHKS